MEPHSLVCRIWTGSAEVLGTKTLGTHLTLTIGVAYREVTGDDDDEDNHTVVPTNWPKGAEEKVPSEISYSLAPGAERQWGYDISPGGRKMVWTKLELEQQERPDELRMILDALDGMRNLSFEDTIQREELPSYPGKDPVDIVADYLTYIREHLVEELLQTYGAEFLSSLPVDLVVSVPAVSKSFCQQWGFVLICALDLVGSSQKSNLPCYSPGWLHYKSTFQELPGDDNGQ